VLLQGLIAHLASRAAVDESGNWVVCCSDARKRLQQLLLAVSCQVHCECTTQLPHALLVSCRSLEQPLLRPWQVLLHLLLRVLVAFTV
jgi:hypothetical protein